MTASQRLITATYDGVTLWLYVNGVFTGNMTSAATYGFTSAQFVWDFMLDATWTATGLVAQAWDFRYILKCLSPAEVWALWEPPTRNEAYWVPAARSYGFLAGAGTVIPPTQETSTVYVLN